MPRVIYTTVLEDITYLLEFGDEALKALEAVAKFAPYDAPEHGDAFHLVGRWQAISERLRATYSL